MKKYIMFFAILALITSCTGGGFSGSSSNSKWNTGTEGIVFNFYQNKPPAIIRGDTMSVVVQYSNKGAQPVDNLIFYLHGYDPSIVFGGATQTHSAPHLDGKSEFNTQGSTPEFAEWESGISSPPGNEDFPQKLSVTACYTYKTEAQASLCINPDYDEYDVVSTGGCTPGASGLSSSQGAPMAVTGIKSYTEDDTVYLELTVQNKGKGTPFSPEVGLSDCYKLAINDRNTITAGARISDGTFTCEPQASYGRTRLDDSGKGVFYCEMTYGEGVARTTPLFIELDYNYAETISKTVTIDR